MDVSNKDERRKYTRIGFATKIRIRIEADGKQVEIDGNSKDLNLKGIFVTADDRFPSGAKCSIQVYLTGGIDEIELQMKGRVVRESENGMGIIFDSMDVDTYSHLKNIVYYNSCDDSV